MQEFHKITNESHQLYQELIDRQEKSINALKQDLIDLSSKDPCENIILLNEQSEQRIQSKITYSTGFLLVSASFISALVAYFFNR